MALAEHSAPVSSAPGRETDAATDGDLAARKRAAIELIRNHDAQLKSSARRYSICTEDAEDAYQRGIEILLSKAPTTDIRQLLPWTRTVIKHESLAVRKQRERILARPATGSDDEETNWIDLIPAGTEGPDERAVKREKVARSREALSQLKPQELKALTMLAEGYSYAEIGAINNWTRTKVNRCLAEGRQSFRSRFSESEAGALCKEFEPLISASCDGEIGAEDLAKLEIHLGACGHCRGTLRAYRAAPKAAAALLPALPAGGTFLERIQEFYVSLQARIANLAPGSDSSAGAAFGGGTRGMGAAALTKIAAVCAGAAGGAACVATGVLPAPVLERSDEVERPPARPSIERTVALPAEVPGSETQSPSRKTEAPKSNPGGPARSEAESQGNRRARAPEPTPTETEFTPEAAGTPVQSAPQTYVPPPPPPPAPTPSAQVPVGGGGGEFGP